MTNHDTTMLAPLATVLMSGGADQTNLANVEWKIKDLVERYPPVWTNLNKKIIAEIVALTGADQGQGEDGKVQVSRWKAPAELPKVVHSTTHVLPEAGFYAYGEPSIGAGASGELHWHLNFADPYVFGYYGGSLLAQDELQVVEHPILASVKRAMEDERAHGIDGLRPWTVDLGSNDPTPVLVEGAPRCCALDTTHIYGDNFAIASSTTIKKATTRLDPPTISNILALAAPSPGRGVYKASQIQAAFLTAYAGFRAMVLGSHGKDAILHTGNWGCGAFGGNKGLMAAVQILAAGTAGVSRVHFWYGWTDLDRSALEHGIEVANALNGKPTHKAINLLAESGYQWGYANENHVEYEPPKKSILDLL